MYPPRPFRRHSTRRSFGQRLNPVECAVDETSTDQDFGPSRQLARMNITGAGAGKSLGGGRRPSVIRYPGFGLGLAVAVLCLFPPSAMALSGPQLLTFDGYETGTAISNQYQGQGIIFREEGGYYPEIRWDEAAWTNPVLSGAIGFGSPISAEFVVPGTTTPATVENLAMDVGYINEPGSTQLVVDHADSSASDLVAEEYGFNHLIEAGGGISGFQLEPVGEEPAGFELDNLEYAIPAPPPPPLPPAPPVPSCSAYLIYDSRGSGEKKGVISKPASKFLLGFLTKAHSIGNSSSVGQGLNPYPAVGVFSWTDIGQDINGLGAFLHAGMIGHYWDSVRKGEQNLEGFLKHQLASPCSHSGATKLILLGYSQGAQVAGNVYEHLYPHLAPQQRKQIAAVVLWGDPRYNPFDNKADRDNRVRFGLLGPRAKFPDPGKVFSYCNTHDPICQEPMPKAELLYYRTKEHSLYYKTHEAKNDGSAVASYLLGRH